MSSRQRESERLRTLHVLLSRNGSDLGLSLSRSSLEPVNSENLTTPHALRALANVKVTKIFSGPSAMHAVAVDGMSKSFRSRAGPTIPRIYS
jgi:hypothetical protein